MQILISQDCCFQSACGKTENNINFVFFSLQCYITYKCVSVTDLTSTHIVVSAFNSDFIIHSQLGGGLPYIAFQCQRQHKIQFINRLINQSINQSIIVISLNQPFGAETRIFWDNWIIPWLLITWLLVLSGLQQTQYWLCINGYFSSM